MQKEQIGLNDENFIIQFDVRFDVIYRPCHDCPVLEERFTFEQSFTLDLSKGVSMIPYDRIRYLRKNI